MRILEASILLHCLSLAPANKAGVRVVRHSTVLHFHHKLANHLNLFHGLRIPRLIIIRFALSVSPPHARSRRCIHQCINACIQVCSLLLLPSGSEVSNLRKVKLRTPRGAEIIMDWRQAIHGKENNEK
jgi:hypothetical protein